MSARRRAKGCAGGARRSSALREGGGRWRCRTAAGTTAAWLALGLGSADAAEFPGPVRWGGTLTVASETVRHGIAWSGGRAAVAAEIDAVTDQGFSASLGLDGPAYPEVGAGAEWTLSVARSWQLDADWSGQWSWSRYSLVGPRAARQAGYDEFGLTVAWRGRAFVALAVAPDRRGFDPAASTTRSGRTAALDLGVTQRLAGRLSLDAGVGIATVTAGRRRNYLYGSIGLRWGLGPVQAQLGRVDSQAERRGVAAAGQGGSRWLATASWTF